MIKFHDNILNSFQVTDRTRVCGRNCNFQCSKFLSGWLAQSYPRATGNHEVAGSSLRLVTCFCGKLFPPTANSSRAAVGGWRKDGHLVLLYG